MLRVAGLDSHWYLPWTVLVCICKCSQKYMPVSKTCDEKCKWQVERDIEHAFWMFTLPTWRKTTLGSEDLLIRAARIRTASLAHGHSHPSSLLCSFYNNSLENFNLWLHEMGGSIQEGTKANIFIVMQEPYTCWHQGVNEAVLRDTSHGDRKDRSSSLPGL